LDASSSQTRCTNGKTCERRRREVSGGVLAAVLKCSRVYVRELTASGVLTRNKAGYLLRPNVGAYVEHLRRERGQDLSPRSEAAAEHHRLRAQMVALQIATHEKRYVPVEVYVAMTDDMTGMFLTALSSLPAIMAPHDLTGRRKWEGFVYDTRKRLADKALQLAEEADRDDRRRA